MSKRGLGGNSPYGAYVLPSARHQVGILTPRGRETSQIVKQSYDFSPSLSISLSPPLCLSTYIWKERGERKREIRGKEELACEWYICTHVKSWKWGGETPNIYYIWIETMQIDKMINKYIILHIYMNTWCNDGLSINYSLIRILYYSPIQLPEAWWFQIQT